MRRAMAVVCLAAALAAQATEARGQAQAPDASQMAVALATRESGAYVKAFNDRKLNDMTALFTPDADAVVLEGATVEKLSYALVRGRQEIVDCHDTLFELYPDIKLKDTVIHARLIRPDVLVADHEVEMTGLPSDVGIIRGRTLTIHVLESGAWKTASARNLSTEVKEKAPTR